MDENLDKRIKNLDELKVQVDLSRYAHKKKKGGVNGQISEIRSLLLTMMNTPKPHKPGEKKYKPMSMIVISSLTRGWTAQELYEIYRGCIEFSKNPQALFWIKYKEFNKKYGQKIKERIEYRRFQKVGKKGRGDKQEERNQALF